MLEIVLLDGTQDGVAQISAALANRQGLDAVHIISHGSDGVLQLGSTELDSASLRGNALAILNWGNALATGADIMLYGCDVAQTEAGQRFVDSLGQLTGADMAASSNLTGSAALHGDWTLEYTAAGVHTKVVADSAIQFSYSGVLALYTVSNNADSGAGSLRQAIIDANANAGADTIGFDPVALDFSAGAVNITLATVLPTITDSVTIDARVAGIYTSTPLI
ncbi:MAG: DUF4347 domain-containing protein [Janthinobacterium lividum]